MSKWLLILVLALITACLGDTTWVSDTVSGIWTADGNPYVFTGDCYIADGESLFIEEGVIIQNSVDSTLFLYAEFRLRIEGMESDTVNITGITIEKALSIDYCKVDSCIIGLINPIICYNINICCCSLGIACNRNGTEIYFSEISNCDVGVASQRPEGTIVVWRTLFHHNRLGLFSDINYYAPISNCISYLYYCTFESNDYSIMGVLDSYWESTGSGGWWEYVYSFIGIYNSLNCDPYQFESYDYSILNRNTFYIPNYSTGEGEDPCFVDTMSFNYHLADSSPYIDMADTSYGIPPDSFYGSAPDLGAFEYTPIIIEENLPSTKPEAFSLSAYPNPFNSAVTISAPAGAEVEVFDVNGRRVAQLPDGGTVGANLVFAQPQGDHKDRPYETEFIWQPDESVGSGVYLVRATMGEETATKRVVYLK